MLKIMLIACLLTSPVKPYSLGGNEAGDDDYTPTQETYQTQETQEMNTVSEETSYEETSYEETSYEETSYESETYSESQSSDDESGDMVGDYSWVLNSTVGYNKEVVKPTTPKEETVTPPTDPEPADEETFEEEDDEETFEEEDDEETFEEEDDEETFEEEDDDFNYEDNDDEEDEKKKKFDPRRFIPRTGVDGPVDYESLLQSLENDPLISFIDQYSNIILLSFAGILFLALVANKALKHY